MFHKGVTQSVFSISNVEETALGAVNSMDQIPEGASEMLLHPKGVLWVWMVSREQVMGQYCTFCDCMGRCCGKVKKRWGCSRNGLECHGWSGP